MTVMEKGVCRQLLDWLIEQIEILDQHIESMADVAGDSREVVDLLDIQLREAREWLCQQLMDALEARGIPVGPHAVPVPADQAREFALWFERWLG